MESNSKSMDGNSQYYIDVILPKLIYTISIQCLPIFLGKLYKLSLKLT